ncbi:hypothetical protein BGX29_000344 [Mortierella sp. GBA35]|nr:hypothetical protein BGX29_000344 [Mortierella sp. GBA35]
MFSSSQGDPPLHVASSNSLPSGNSELTARGGHTLSHLSQAAKQGRLSSKGRRKTPSIMQGVAAIQLGPGSLLSPLGNHTVRYAAIKGEHETGSKGSKRSRIKKRLSRFIHGEPNGTGTNTSHPVHHIGIALLEAKINPAALDPVTPVRSNSVTTAISSSGQVAIATAFIPAVQPQSTPASIGPLRLDIFPEDVAAPVLTTDPPKSHARIKETSQLVFCYSLPSKARSPLSSNGNSYGSEETPIDERQREWALTMDPIGQNHLHWLIDQLVKAFAQDQLKDAAAVTEIVLLGPVLDRETYRSLLSCFISKFEQTTPLDLTLLQGLVQLVECASTNYLVDNDLVSIATVLSRELSKTHTGNSDHPLQLMWALSRVLDTMVALEVKDVDRNRDHQPIKQLLGSLKDSEVVYLKYQATYAYQALQYAPDDETPLQTVWRYSQVAATAASAVSSVFKLDPSGLLDVRRRRCQIRDRDFQHTS